MRYESDLGYFSQLLSACNSWKLQQLHFSWKKHSEIVPIAPVNPFVMDLLSSSSY